MLTGLRSIGQGFWRFLGIESESAVEVDRDGIERPWLISWHAVPKRSAAPRQALEFERAAAGYPEGGVGPKVLSRSAPPRNAVGASSVPSARHSDD